MINDALITIGASVARLLPAEAAHDLALLGLRAMPRAGATPVDPRLRTSLAGLTLASPVGLAAGFDKNAAAVDALLGLGFGFVEVGAVTPRPQPGNPKPRVFRLTKDRAIINRLGFNNAGMAVVAQRLEARRAAGRGGVVGVNLGANKDSADFAQDYVVVLKELWGLAEFFTVNVSSPNTPGLRNLQGADALQALLERIGEARAALSGHAPIFLKVAPDLSAEQIDDMISVLDKTHVADGLVVSNTTKTRPASFSSPHRKETGGLSGAPLFDLATRALRLFAERLDGAMPLIGVGGVEDAATAYAKIRAGASAVQLYTGLVYQGPSVIKRIENGLVQSLRLENLDGIGDAVGADRHRQT